MQKLICKSWFKYVQILAIVALMLFFDRQLLKQCSFIILGTHFTNVVQIIMMFWQFMCYVAIFCLVLINNRYLRIFSALFITLGFYTDYVFYQITGNEISLADIDLLLENTVVAGNAAKNFSLFIIKGVIPAMFLLTLLLIKPIKTKINDLVYLAFFLIVLTALLPSTTKREEFDFITPAPLRLPLFMITHIAHPMPKVDFKPVNIQALNKTEIRNIVLVVDESAAGGPEYCGFYQQYFKPEQIVCNAYASGNCTHISRAYLRLGVTQNQNKATALQGTTIWQYAKAAGFKTHLLGPEQKNMHLFYQPEINQIDDLQIIPIVQDPSADAHIAQMLLKTLEIPGKNFILVYKNGVHFYYDDSYPPQEAVFLPKMANNFSKNMMEVKNSYKNALKWSTNSFFTPISQNLPKNTVLIYTSDHGEYLALDKVGQPHCSTKNPPQTEFLVPIGIMANENLFVKQGITSHFNIFPTILNLMGYEQNKIQNLYGKTLLQNRNNCVKAFFGDVVSRLEPTTEIQFCK